MNRMDMIRKFREDNGLSVQEMREIMNTVLHPTELRDQIAIAAMQAMLTGQSWNVSELTEMSYKVADGMLKERIKEKENKDGI